MKIEDIQVAHTTSTIGELPAERLPEIAFLGRSNVGKSSLINSLVNRRKLARTAKAPGRTRAIHWYRIAGGGLACFFVDLPGYGYAKVSRRIREEVWAPLIETYLSGSPQLTLAVQLLDIRRSGPTDLDLQMIQWLDAAGVPTVYALTKADKLSRSRRLHAAHTFSRHLGLGVESAPIPYSAVSGEGKAQLWARIDSRVRAAA